MKEGSEGWVVSFFLSAWEEDVPRYLSAGTWRVSPLEMWKQKPNNEFIWFPESLRF